MFKFSCFMGWSSIKLNGKCFFVVWGGGGGWGKPVGGGGETQEVDGAHVNFCLLNPQKVKKSEKEKQSRG